MAKKVGIILLALFFAFLFLHCAPGLANEDVMGSRRSLATCQIGGALPRGLGPIGSITACSAHCLGRGFWRGGYCHRETRVCHCRGKRLW